MIILPVLAETQFNFQNAFLNNYQVLQHILTHTEWVLEAAAMIICIQNQGDMTIQ